jgi:hypothetical protein
MSQKKCGHCREPGHTQPNCPRVTQDAEIIHLHLRNIRDTGNGNREIQLRMYLRLYTVHELTILMKHIKVKLNPLILKLVERNKITFQESLLAFKCNRIKVLMWYYWYTSTRYATLRREHLANPSIPRGAPPEKKLNILAKSFEFETNLAEFECPICVACKPGKERTVTNCNHEVCKTCIDQYLEHQITTVNFPQPRCSLCRTQMTTITFANTDYIEEVSNKYFKVHVLM